MLTVQKLFLTSAFIGMSYTIAQPAQAISFSAAGTPSPIADSIGNVATPTDFVFAVSGFSATAPISVTLNLNIFHPDLQQLETYLISPTSQTLSIFTFISGTSINTTFSDSGNPPDGLGITEPSTIPNFAGFSGFNPNGTWTLRVYDSVTGDVGTLNSATLNVESVPFEFEGSAGMAILGSSFALRRWYKKRKESSK